MARASSDSSSGSSRVILSGPHGIRVDQVRCYCKRLLHPGPGRSIKDSPLDGEGFVGLVLRLPRHPPAAPRPKGVGLCGRFAAEAQGRTGCHAAALPSSFSRRFNTDGEGVSAKRQSQCALSLTGRARPPAAGWPESAPPPGRQAGRSVGPPPRPAPRLEPEAAGCKTEVIRAIVVEDSPYLLHGL